MRFIYSWTFHLSFAGALLFFVHSTLGQRTRVLIEPPVGQEQQPSTETTLPAPATSQPTPAQTLMQLFQAMATDEKTALSVNQLTRPSVEIKPITLPSTISTRILGDSNTALYLQTDNSEQSQSDNPEQSTTIFTEPVADQPTTMLVSSVLEEYTEYEREKREMEAQRQRAELITDPERRQSELDRAAVVEANYQNRLARRQLDEAGANLFYFPRLKESLLQNGWCQLFDGHTDFGWKVQNEGPYAGGKFTFGQHEICSDPYYPGLIYTQIPFGDVSVQFDYWAEKGSEAYLLMKTPPNPADLNSSCYAFVLNSRHSTRPSGVPLGRHGLDSRTLQEIHELQNLRNNTSNEEGAWRSFSVRFENDRYQVSLNKNPPEFYFDRVPISNGHIALLVTRGKVRFQNIMWQPSQPIAIFSTETSTTLPWQLSANTEFSGDSITGFRLHNGRMESKETFTDYMLQVEYMQGTLHGQAALFVRSLQGMEKSGYEISLQNFPRRQDREAAIGVDAGAFRMFEDARCLRLPDRQWTYLTAVVMGRQLQTWINGVPVCYIEDKRKNQTATGPFLAPGAISLTVPSENTSFQFRHLTVSPIL